MVLIELVLVFLLTLALWIDFQYGIIPNELIYIGITGCILVFLQWPDRTVFLQIGKQICSIGLFLYPMYKIGVIGAGDIKLMFMCIFFQPHHNALTMLFGAFVAGALIGLWKLWREDLWRERISYFFSYVTDVARERQWKIYEEEICPTTCYVKRAAAIEPYKIHFSLPIVISVFLQMGGWY